MRKLRRFFRRLPPYALPLGLISLTTLMTLSLLFAFSGTPHAPKLKTGRGETLYIAGNKTFSASIGTKNGDAKIGFSVGESKADFVLAGSERVVPKKESGTSVFFPQVAKDTDLRYTTMVNGLKEELILHQAPVKVGEQPSNIFLFDLLLSNVVPKKLVNDFIDPTFKDALGNYQFHFEKPFAIDAQGVRTDNVLLQIGEDKQIAGKYYMKLIVDEAWLNDPDRSYPVTIDPTIVHDSTSEFAAGYFDRVKDTGSGSAPSLESYYQELSSGPNTVGLWHLNEGTDNTCSGGQDTCDASGNGFHGTFSGNAAFTSSKILGSYATTYDGTTDYTSSGDIATIDAATTLSACAWVYPTSDTTDGGIMAKSNTTTDGMLFFRDDVGSVSGRTDIYTIFIADSADTDTARVESATNSGPANVWTHVCFTYQANSPVGLRLYINGIEDVNSPQTTGTVGAIDSTTNPFTIGARSDGNTGFTGNIDEVAVSTKIFTAEEVKSYASRRPSAVYTSPVLDLTNAVTWNSFSWTELGVNTGDGETLKSNNGLIAQWNFNETSGTTADNAEGTAALDGILTSFASTASQDQAPTTGWTTNNKRWGAGSLMFDGTNDYVDAGSNAALQTVGDFSVESWFKTSNIVNSGPIASYGTTSDWLYYFGTSAGFLTCKIYQANSGSGYLQATSGSITADGLWHHGVCTVSGNTVSVYIDGKIVATTSTTSGTRDVSSAGTLTLGKFTNTTSLFLGGVLDSTRLYSRVLDASEIMSNYQAGNIEFQTRVGADTSPSDGSWEAWRPTTSESLVVAFDDTASDTDWSQDYRANPSGNMIEFNSTNVAGGNAYSYVKTEGDTTVVATGDTFEYDVFALNNIAGTGGIDIKYTDLTYARDSGWQAQDSTNCLGDVQSTAYYRWYHRICTITSTDNGKTVDFIDLVNEDDTGAVVKAYYDNLVIKNSSGVIKSIIYTDGATEFNSTDLENNASNTGTSALSTSNQVNTLRQEDSAAPIYFSGTGALKISNNPLADLRTAGFWHLDETGGSGAYFKDATGNANHLTPTGTTVIQGVVGKGRSFNGSSDSATCTDAACGGTGIDKLDPSSTDFSMSAWIKTTNTARQMIISKGSSAGQYAYSLETGLSTPGAPGILFYNTVDTTYIAAHSATSIADGKWHHVVGSYDGTTASIYVDGVLSASSATSGGTQVTNSTGDFFIGSRAAGSYWNGSIDEVLVTKSTISSNEVAEAYRLGRNHYLTLTGGATDLSGKTTLPFYVAGDRPGSYLTATLGESLFSNYQRDGNTRGLWHLDEASASGTYLRDSSGNANHVTPTGAMFADGKIGKARSFNGTGQYLSCTDAACGGTTKLDPSSGSWSIGAWIKTSKVPGQYIVNKGTATTQFAYSLLLSNGGSPRFVLLNTVDGNYIEASASARFNDGNWHHIVGTYDGTTASIYADSQLQASSTTKTGTQVTNSTSDFQIGWGASAAANYFNGLIDEVFVTASAPSASDIRQMYELSQRSHPITIDFNSAISHTDPLSSSTDLTFTLMATPSGTVNPGDNIYPSDEIIVRENYDGTTYLAQGTVGTVNTATGAVTVTSWGTGSTFPSGGFTPNATVFKWQREYWNFSEPLNTQVDGIIYLTLRFSDGSEGRNVYLDDLRSNGDYLTTPGGSTITSSTGNRYMQYRAVFSSFDEAVSATLSAITLDYTSNAVPNAPSLDAPADTAANQSLSPVLQTTTTDAESDYLRYKIELCTNVGMTTGCQTFDQTVSQTGWSGQNAQTSTAYTSGTQATYTIQTPLAANTTYYWRSYAVDPGGSNTWSATQSPAHSFSTSTSPTAPTTPYAEGASNPSNVIDLTPEFSAIHNDGDADTANQYEVEVNTASDFSGTVMWDSGQTSMTSTANGVRSPDISYAGTALTFTGSTYYWRIRFTDVNGAVGAWSATQNFTMNTLPATPLLDLPLSGATNVSPTAELRTTATDANGDYLRYKIEICTNVGMTTGCQTYDQTVSQTGWSGQDVQTSTAYASGTQATYTIQTPLAATTTYYWRSYAIDPGGANTFGSTQTTPFSFTTMNAPESANNCRINENNTDTTATVVWTDVSAVEDRYEVQRNVDGGGFVVLATNLAAGTSSYADTTITQGHTYQYRVAPYFIGPTYGEWCTTSTLSIQSGTFQFNGLNMNGLKIN